MNIGEYLRETLSVTAYDALIDRLALPGTAEADDEDHLAAALPAIEERLQRETERVQRLVRANWVRLDPFLSRTTREQGRHLAYRRLAGLDAFEVIERIPADDGSAIGCWRERPITRVVWQVAERRWRCGCREYVRERACTHAATLSAFDRETAHSPLPLEAQPPIGLCSCGGPEFVCGLCYLCHLHKEQQWSKLSYSAGRAQGRFGI